MQVICVAEGAGQTTLKQNSTKTDASGNPILEDVGLYLRDRMKASIKVIPFLGFASPKEAQSSLRDTSMLLKISSALSQLRLSEEVVAVRIQLVCMCVEPL